MEHPNFEISSDAARCLLRIAMRGHWRVETVREYREAVFAEGAALLAAGCAVKDIRSLVDARSLGPQSQDVVAAYQAAFSDEDAQVGKVAMLMGSALFQLQVKRVAQDGPRTFSDEAAALSWLLDDTA